MDHQNTLRVDVALDRLGSCRQEPENGVRVERAPLGTELCSLCTHDLEQDEHPGPWQTCHSPRSGLS